MYAFTVLNSFTDVKVKPLGPNQKPTRHPNTFLTLPGLHVATKYV